MKKALLTLAISVLLAGCNPHLGNHPVAGGGQHSAALRGDVTGVLEAERLVLRDAFHR